MYEHLLRDLFASPTARRTTRAIDLVAAMCQFERALAEVQAARGTVDAAAAQAIATALQPDIFDLEALAQDAPDGGNMAVAFVKQAKARVPAEWRGALHVGATSQDLVDTALMLVIKPRLAACLTKVDQSLAAGQQQMRAHRETPMAGRTLTQQALPITAGAKIAQWMHGLFLAREALAHCYENGLFVQFGGPVGTHHGLADGLGEMADLAERLGLVCPQLPWHTQRQPVRHIGNALQDVAAAADKIATDIAWMAQTEVGEAREPATVGAGGSSSMPHKANPVGSTRIRAAAQHIRASLAALNQAAAHPHERSFGEWHAEWAPLLDAVILTEGLLETLAPLLDGLEIDAAAMRRNLALPAGANLGAPSRALLAPHLDSETARCVIAAAVAEARETGVPYAEALSGMPVVAAVLRPDAVRSALDPAQYTGSSTAQVHRMAELIDQALSQSPTSSDNKRG